MTDLDLEVAYNFGDLTVGKAGADDSYIALIIGDAAVSLDHDAARFFIYATAAAATGTLAGSWDLPTADFEVTQGGTGRVAVEPYGPGGGTIFIDDHTGGRSDFTSLDSADLGSVVTIVAAFLHQM